MYFNLITLSVVVDGNYALLCYYVEVNSYRYFGTTCRSLLQGSRNVDI